MYDHDLFESRLHAALRRYVAPVTSDLDPVAFAHAVATAEPRRPAGVFAGWRTLPLGRLAWLLLIAALLGALVAAALLAGGSPAHAEWQRLDVPGGGSFAEIAAGSGGHVAVGRDSNGNAAFWTSSDCEAWNPAAVAATSVEDVVAVVAQGSGYVAIGYAGAVWGSADGRAWRQVGQLPFAIGSNIGVGDLAARGDRLVAVGSISDADGNRQAIWTSEGGAGWTRVDPLDRAETGYIGGALDRVVATAEGFVAVGSADTGIPIWTSPDGATWTRVAGEMPGNGTTIDGLDWTELRSVAIDRSGAWIAFGNHRSTGFGAWTSRDGQTWTFQATSGISGSAFDLPSVVATANGFVAVGIEEANPVPSPATSTGDLSDPSQYPYRALMWTSADGRSWTPVSPPVSDHATLETALTCGSDLLVSGVFASSVYADPPLPVGFAWRQTAAVWLLPGGATGILPTTSTK